MEITDVRITEEIGFEKYFSIEFDFKIESQIVGDRVMTSKLRLSCADYYSIESNGQDIKKFLSEFKNMFLTYKYCKGSCYGCHTDGNCEDNLKLIKEWSK